MSRAAPLALALALVPALASAAPAQSAAPAKAPPAAQQIAAAVLPLPKEFRDGATVMGYGEDGKLSTLRAGRGDMVCLADDPSAPRFHVACYHKGLEPFMARGRALRASGVTGAQVDSVRFAEIRSGKLALPRTPSSLYSLTSTEGTFDPATGTIAKASPLHVIYIPNATAETTGLSTTPSEKVAWLMFPGTPKAHIMFTVGM